MIGKEDRRVEKFCFDKPFACQTLAKPASVASSEWEPAKNFRIVTLLIFNLIANSSES